MANLNPPPIQTAVDAAGGSVSFPWKQWFGALYSKLFGAVGLQFLNNAYASVLCTTTQTAAGANTPQKVTLDTASLANGASLVGNALYVSQAGFYELNVDAQLTNAAATVQQVYVWIRKNGVDVASSGCAVSVDPIAGMVLGYSYLAANQVMQLAAGDYIEVWWATDSTSAKLTATAAIISPFHMPAVPSVTVTLALVSSVS